MFTVSPTVSVGLGVGLGVGCALARVHAGEILVSTTTPPLEERPGTLDVQVPWTNG